MNMPAVVENEKNISATSLILNSESFASITSLAQIMSSGNVSVPKHLHGNVADCTAIIMQSMQWGMNPFAVAQKTHISQGGQLSYEAQLVNAVINSVGPLDGRPSYEFIGDWEKILGRVKEMSSDKGGKYYVKDWQQNDEIGLGVICNYKIIGEQGSRKITVMLKQCWPRFSTQWATDPQQQICYSAIKKVARREFPDVILGVYTPDELEEVHSEREINPSPAKADQPENLLPVMDQERFKQNFPSYESGIKSGRKTADVVIAAIQTKYTLTAEQENAIRSVAAPIEGQAEVIA